MTESRRTAEAEAMTTSTDLPALFHPCGLVTMTTDFGTADGYLGAMKGSILNHDARLRIENIAHEIPPQNIIHGATALAAAAPYWPKGTVHMVVVDPGVGTERRALAAVAGGQCFVAPDNGVLGPTLERLGPVLCHQIERNRDTEPFLPVDLAPTFHGRDLFAPIAAALASGALSPHQTGPRCEPLPLPRPHPLHRGNHIEGTILLFDHFGNAITNLPREDLPETCSVKLPGGGGVVSLCRTYGDVAEGEPLALIGSGGCLEIAIRNGNAKRSLGLRVDDKLQVRE